MCQEQEWWYQCVHQYCCVNNSYTLKIWMPDRKRMEEDFKPPDWQVSGVSGLSPSGYLHFDHNCPRVSGSFPNCWYLCPTSGDCHFVGLGCGLGGGKIPGIDKLGNCCSALFSILAGIWGRWWGAEKNCGLHLALGIFVHFYSKHVHKHYLRRLSSVYVRDYILWKFNY